MKKVLAVDNHPLILKFLTTLLTSENCQVKTAVNGLEALDVLSQYHPDIVFIDLIMPNIDGETLCRIIRRNPQFEKTYLVILSAIAVETKVDFISFGADACIAKGPFVKMKKHILDVLSEAADMTIKKGSGNIRGLEDLYAREITCELLSIKRHFEIVLKSVSEGIMEITDNNRIIFANPVAISLSGISEEELLASDFRELFNGEDRRKIGALLERLKDHSSFFNKGVEAVINNRELEISVSPVNSGKEGAIVILIDITERNYWQTHLRQKEKMESVGTLAAGVAHDFNNLLMGIKGNTSLLLLEMTSDHPHYKRLRSIEKQVASSASLIKQLLGYARQGRDEVETMNLNRLVGETADIMARTRRDITIHMELAADLRDIEADVGQIEQVLLNLLINAGDAMPQGGDLFLKTANVGHLEMHSKIFKVKANVYIILMVTDTGIGMDKKTRERIFEPFFTTKEMGRGTGLGLASTYGIIKGHGGYIEVESKQGKGTTFKIYLPV
jgi:PAS domain S-box-containing protein